jgi:site-specific DNA-methyltransferase (adenine-specific)
MSLLLKECENTMMTMASDPGSLVLDPFGGSGTTFVAAELLGRNWIGIELESTAIVERFENINADADYLAKLTASKNRLFTSDSLKLRKQFGHDSSKYRINATVQEPEFKLQPILI